MADIQIPVTAPINIPTPAVGMVTLFIDTTNNNILSYMDANRIVLPYYGSAVQAMADCCACEIAKDTMSKMACALSNGTITATEYAAFIAAGLTISATETPTINGGTICTLNVSPFIPAIVPVASVSVTGTQAIGIDGTSQLVAVILPANATNLSLLWISSDPAIASVDANGLVTGVAIGVATITVYTVDGLYYDTIVITVS